MRLSGERIKSLQTLLKEQYGLELNSEQAQEAGLAIMRFVAIKSKREQMLAKRKRDGDGQLRGDSRAITE